MHIGDIGERYIQNELTRMGLVHAYLANSSKQKGWDIVIFKKASEKSELFKAEKIQVKSLNWKNESSKVINGDFSKESDFNYLCIVIINYKKEQPYVSYIIPKEKLAPKEGNYILYNDEKGTIQYTNSTITLNSLESYEDKIQKLSEDTWKRVIK